MFGCPLDPLNPDLKTFAEIVDEYPIPLTSSTLHRYQREGLDGVFLSSIVVAGKRRTTTSALDEFLRATSKPTGEKPPRPPRRRSLPKLLPTRCWTGRASP